MKNNLILKNVKILFALFIVIFCFGCSNKEYVVSFETNGGNVISNEIVEKDHKINIPNNPEKDGYIFVEWTLNGEPFDFGSKPNKDITLEAKWEEKSDKKIDNAKKSLKSIYYINSKSDLNLTYDNCEFNLKNSDRYKRIIRSESDQKLELEYDILCDNDKESVKVNAIIKKSPYTYTSVMNMNKINYDIVLSTKELLNGTIYNFNGNYLSDLIDSKAIINNQDIENDPIFKMIINDDSDTIYLVSKK